MSSILVIDDESDFLDYTADTLSRHGYRTYKALDGSRGTELARRHLPDLVLCDIHMRPMDGFATLDQGALIVPVQENTDTKDVPPLILLKSDGAVLYGTTDLATIIDRVRSHDPDLILYVVDQRQHTHFEQVFRAAKKTGLAGRAELEHIGYGTVNGSDGKPFKTRAGGVMKLFDLIAMATEEAGKRLAEQGLAADYPEEEIGRAHV